MKLADIYFTENNGLGTWAQIGYNAPNGSGGAAASSTNFSYSLHEAVTSGEATWKAKNKVALNDCAINDDNYWDLVPTVSDGSVSWVATAHGNACSVLTPNFNNIGK